MKILSAIDKKTMDRIKWLETVLPKASEDYYNTGKYSTIDGIKFTDPVYDELEQELKTLSPKSKILKRIGAPVKNKKVKVKLPYFMPSLDKVYPNTGNVDKWLLGHKINSYVVSDKLDGTSVQIIYSNGVPTKAFTRGDGSYGGDISFLIPHLKIPKRVGTSDFAIRGEMIISRAAFNSFYSKKVGGDFENPRNMVSGITNRRDIHRGLKHMDVIVYQVLDPLMKPSRQLSWCKAKGFTIVPHKIITKLDDAFLSKALASRKSVSKYDIDGLVVAMDTIISSSELKNPEHSIAFKENIEDNKAVVTVTNVLWEESKHGFLKPVVEFNPVALEGVTVKQATGHNAAMIVKGKIGPGSKIEIIRSGGVIPTILRVIKGTKAQLPSKKDFGEYDWNSTEVDLVLVNPHESDLVVAKQITEFFVIMGVENFALRTVQRFMETGLDSVLKILKASKKQMLEVPGIKDTMATKIYNNIHKAMDSVELPTLMYASQQFGRSFGSKRLASIVKAYPNILKLGETLTTKQIMEKIITIEGFSDVTARQFATNLSNFIKWLSKHSAYITYVVPKKKIIGTKLKNQRIAFTGIRDNELEEKIIANGGEIATSVNSKTTILICKDIHASTTKLNAARSLGIRILTIPMFVKRYSL